MTDFHAGMTVTDRFTALERQVENLTNEVTSLHGQLGEVAQRTSAEVHDVAEQVAETASDIPEAAAETPGDIVEEAQDDTQADQDIENIENVGDGGDTEVGDVVHDVVEVPTDVVEQVGEKVGDIGEVVEDIAEAVVPERAPQRTHPLHRKINLFGKKAS